MRTASVVVRSATGLHSRPADLFVRTARLYDCTVTVARGKKSCDARNIIKVILLNVSCGEEITIATEGPDEDAAIEDLKTLVESNFSVVNECVQG